MYIYIAANHGTRGQDTPSVEHRFGPALASAENLDVVLCFPVSFRTNDTFSTLNPQPPSPVNPES